MYLIDTNVLSDLATDKASAAVQRWTNLHMADAALPTTTIFELRLGVAQMADGARRDALMLAIERAITRFGPRIYAFDRASAEMAGELIGLMARKGRVLKRIDAQIAGIAAVYGLTIVARNVKDFEDTGIDVVNPWDG